MEGLCGFQHALLEHYVKSRSNPKLQAFLVFLSKISHTEVGNDHVANIGCEN